MTRTDLVAILAVIALIAAIAADVIALAARRYGARALLTAHTHPRQQDPPPAPRNLAVDRRLDDHGPPEGQPERRARHADPGDQRARRRDVDDPRWHVTDQQLTPEDAAEIRQRMREVGRGLEPSAPPTAEQHPPTRDMRRIPPEDRPW